MRLTACIIAGLLAASGAAHGQTNPAPASPKAPTDRKISGEFSPVRVDADQEAAAKKAQETGTSQLPRGRRFYFLWSTLTPAEFEGLARHTLFLISVWTQKPEELPVKRVYIRADGQERPVYKVWNWKMLVPASSLTAKMYGPNREDGFYLVPGGAMLRKGEIVMDLAGQTGWVMLELPSNVASADARRFANPDPQPDARPNLGTLQSIVTRRFPGFPVPQSLP
jgi:hypothetical protein